MCSLPSVIIFSKKNDAPTNPQVDLSTKKWRIFLCDRFSVACCGVGIVRRAWCSSRWWKSAAHRGDRKCDCVEDINRLESDKGLKMLLLEQECKGMARKLRRAYLRRFRKIKSRALPSPSSIRRYLEEFHNKEEEAKRVTGTAFIPQANNALMALPYSASFSKEAFILSLLRFPLLVIVSQENRRQFFLI